MDWERYELDERIERLANDRSELQEVLAKVVAMIDDADQNCRYYSFSREEADNLRRVLADTSK